MAEVVGLNHAGPNIDRRVFQRTASLRLQPTMLACNRATKTDTQPVQPPKYVSLTRFFMNLRRYISFYLYFYRAAWNATRS